MLKMKWDWPVLALMLMAFIWLTNVDVRQLAMKQQQITVQASIAPELSLMAQSQPGMTAPKEPQPTEPVVVPSPSPEQPPLVVPPGPVVTIQKPKVWWYPLAIFGVNLVMFAVRYWAPNIPGWAGPIISVVISAGLSALGLAVGGVGGIDPTSLITQAGVVQAGASVIHNTIKNAVRGDKLGEGATVDRT